MYSPTIFLVMTLRNISKGTDKIATTKTTIQPIGLKAVQPINSPPNKVATIVVGVPINMDGTYGFQSEDCKNFAGKINGFDIVFEDERLTSNQAEENLRQRKINFRKNKSLVDIESACIILEQYLRK